ncbi:MAG: hypothetical protein A2096_12250 [Spirochaetes bacterium GWF1_41_5]|nr:MAG: hypothetical protein A2096_12250 [Spirochaetes bacterium GWF1_41_5]HBE03968.1 hypothetical protein [Spirochaetia bacterium]
MTLKNPIALQKVLASIENKTLRLKTAVRSKITRPPRVIFPISFKLSVIISALIVVIIIITTAIYVRRERSRIISSMEEKAALLASQLAQSVFDTLSRNEFYISFNRDPNADTRDSLIADILINFRESSKTRDIIYIKLYDKEKTAAISEGGLSGNFPSVPLYSKELGKSREILPQFSRIGAEKDTELQYYKVFVARLLGLENTLYDLAWPVTRPGYAKALGEVHVGISQKGSNALVMATVFSNIILALSMIVTGILLSIPAAFFFTNPVAKIKNAMAAISEGNLDQELPVISRDELGVLTWNFNYMADGLREKEKMRDRFGKAVSEEIVEVMMRGAISLGGEDKSVAMLFSDIRGFTKLASYLNPAEVLEMLNEYFTVMEEIVKRNMGLVDKYVGDAMMAVFGAIDPNQDNEENACRAAVEMMCALEDFNAKRTAAGKKNLAAGIGINSGTVTAGMLGSRNRMNYTVIGDTVNMASRLCDAAATAGFSSILLSDTVYEKVRDIVKVRSGSMLLVKGKENPVHVYELLGIVNRRLGLKLKIDRIKKNGE